MPTESLKYREPPGPDSTVKTNRLFGRTIATDLMRMRLDEMLAWRIPNSELHVLEGAGHLFLVDEPERAIVPIKAFLDSA